MYSTGKLRIYLIGILLTVLVGMLLRPVLFTQSASYDAKLAAVQDIERLLPDLAIDLEQFVRQPDTSLADDLSVGLGLQTKPTSSLDYYLPSHPNPNARVRGTVGGSTMRGHFNIGRNAAPKYIVIHTSEGGGPRSYSVANDRGAEGTAQYFATTSRAASYNALVDSNSIVWTVPQTWTAFQASCCNSSSVGLSVATRAADWQINDTWDDRALLNLAILTAQVNESLNMPYQHISGSSALNGAAGFTGHGEVQPNNRTDPGSKFDWSSFLQVAQIVDNLSDGEAPPVNSGNLQLGSVGQEVRDLQQRLKDLGYDVGVVDGDFGSITESAVLAFQARNDLSADGVVGPLTSEALFAEGALGPEPTDPGDPHPETDPETDPEPDSAASNRWAEARDWLNSLRTAIDQPGKLLAQDDPANHPDAVRIMKRRLIELGYNAGSDTGPTANVFDATVDAAVRQFQFDSGITTDMNTGGIVGAVTWNELFPRSLLYPEEVGRAAADINDDGKVDIFDLSALLSEWNTNDPLADINQDGDVNIFDLSIMLSHWDVEA